MKQRLFSSLCLDYFSLCKPKVVALMLMTAWVGMHLATQSSVPWQPMLFGTLGIALTGGSAAVMNHLLDGSIDAKMQRTASRPIASGRITPINALRFALLLALIGFCILFFFVNLLTTLLTFATVIGYAIVYTLVLKRATPQNIVIGGAVGAMPPLLGWAAVANDLSAYGLLLVLIIFSWTPPHFWALAIFRHEEYQKAEIPMLPVTHGIRFTKLSIILYTLLLLAVTSLPYATGMSGLFYFIAAMILGFGFLSQTLLLYFSSSPSTAMKTFRFSIVYLILLFIVLLIDHYL